MNVVLNPPPASIRLECGPVTALDLALYAASSSDHNPLHLDDEIALAAGFERPVVHGMLTMAFAARLLTAHFGAQALRSLETRFVSVAQRGARIVLTGMLERTEDLIAHYALSAHNEAGELLISGSAQISLRMSEKGEAK